MINGKRFAVLSLISAVVSLLTVGLVFLVAYQTARDWSAIEQHHTEAAVLVDLLRLLFPLAGMAFALMTASGGAALAAYGLFQSGVSKLPYVIALLIIILAASLAVLFVIGMFSFRQG